MSRLQARFAQLQRTQRKALVTFITAGDPQPDCTVAAMHALVAGGADIVELGVPFSDPEAEGPAIQASSERALAHGMTLTKVLALVAEFRSRDAETPVVLMGYVNSVIRMGEQTFAAAAAAAGCDGLIMVNLPPEAASELKSALNTHAMDLIFLVAPTTTPERMAYIASQSSGFLYYVSLKGVTGARHLDPAGVRQKVADIAAQTTLPIMVGFGIRDGAGARAVAEVADGVVVGSVLVHTMGKTPPEGINAALTAQVADLRSALDS